MSQVLDAKDFKMIQKLLYDVAGITLSDKKHQMVENRIAKRLKQIGVPSFAAYTQLLNGAQKDAEFVHLVNALTTNVTHFFREEHHFNHLFEHARDRLRSNDPKIRMWSAGCSIGAEPYSAAMTLWRAMQETGRKGDTRILATDIDTLALARARQGFYQEKLLKGLDPQQLQKYFSKTEMDNVAGYRIKDMLRKMVAFNHLNLNRPRWPMSGLFDFIWCRNVLIYFDRDKQDDFITRMIDLLRPNGFLYLGHSEHAVMEGRGFKVCGQTIYQKPA